MDRFIVFTAILGAFWLLTNWADKVDHGPGVLAPNEPEQSRYHTERATISMGTWKLKPVASYKLTARVAKVKAYDDSEIDNLVPLDFLLGWGPMSDSTHLDELDLNISNRYATWRWWGKPPLDACDISEHMSNHHLVPANDTIRNRLHSVREGDIVTLEGELVNIQDHSGQTHFRSSLTRTDTGPGACEVMLVNFIGIR